jgi:hypothetical protein
LNSRTTNRRPDLDEIISVVAAVARDWASPLYPGREEAVEGTLAQENRFTLEAVTFALNQQFSLLKERALRAWVDGRCGNEPVAVGVLNPGNVPLAGLQDMLAVLLAGHEYYGSVSSKSTILLQAFAQDLMAVCPPLPLLFAPAEAILGAVDAVIASGTTQTMAWVSDRCDEAGIDPRNRLLRGSKTSVGVVGRNEPASVWRHLAEDILLHEGLGCRNVTILWAPEGVSPDPLLSEMARFRAVFPAHPKTVAGLKMPIAFAAASGSPSAYAEDGSFLVTKGTPEVQQPGHLRWVEYLEIDEVHRHLNVVQNEIQLVVRSKQSGLNRIEGLETALPGFAQRPKLDWKPDGYDTIDFLGNLETER